MKKLSVIIPARNEKFLQKTIDGLLENLETDFEIVVGLDDYDANLREDPRVVVYRSNKRIGMRPLINLLVENATGEYLMRADAHIMVKKGIDKVLIDSHKPGYTVVARRYELDTEKWQMRPRTDCDYRYLTPLSDTRGGLRSLAWTDYEAEHHKEKIGDLMTCSGSNWLMKKSQWFGLDENHGTFGQEGAEIALQTWLSGGRMIINKNTWYAHWNRGKACYSLGSHQKKKSIDYSIALWMGNKWPHQKYAFNWIIDKFNPPGWDVKHKGLEVGKQGTKIRGRHEYTIPQIWKHRIGIAEPLKRHRINILYDSFGEMIDNIADKKKRERYLTYLRGHLNKRIRGTEKGEKHALRKLNSGIDLYNDIKKNGLKAPLEFYQEDGKLILHKGYRRLVILQRLGYKEVSIKVFKTKEDALRMSRLYIREKKDTPYRAPRKLKSITELAEEQYVKHGGNATDKYWTHQYTELYDRHFGQMRNRAKKVLELGAFYGASLILWREVFPKAQIFSLDKNETKWQKLTKGLDRIKVVVGMEENNSKIKEVKSYGQYDIIIDDASHDPKKQIQVFKKLWPSVRGRGFYVIEDCFYSYYGGDTKDMPKYSRKENKPSSPKMLADMIPEIYNGEVSEIHFYYNICFIRKL